MGAGPDWSVALQRSAGRRPTARDGPMRGAARRTQRMRRVHSHHGLLAPARSEPVHGPAVLGMRVHRERGTTIGRNRRAVNPWTAKNTGPKLRRLGAAWGDLSAAIKAARLTSARNRAAALDRLRFARRLRARAMQALASARAPGRAARDDARLKCCAGMRREVRHRNTPSDSYSARLAGARRRCGARGSARAVDVAPSPE